MSESEYGPERCEHGVRWANNCELCQGAPEFTGLRDFPPSGSREAAMVVVKRDAAGVPIVWCDPEIVDLVTALNAGGLDTVASCSGHGEGPGRISLKDGRELFIANNYEQAQAVSFAIRGAA